MHEGEKLMRRWFDEVWNQGNLDAIEGMLAEGYATRGLAEFDLKPTTIESIKQFRQQFGAEFSKIKIDVEDVVAVGDRVAARCLVDVTQTATGRRAVFGGMCFVHLKDGKISEAWNNFDFASMRQQLA